MSNVRTEIEAAGVGLSVAERLAWLVEKMASDQRMIVNLTNAGAQRLREELKRAGFGQSDDPWEELRRRLQALVDLAGQMAGKESVIGALREEIDEMGRRTTGEPCRHLNLSPPLLDEDGARFVIGGKCVRECRGCNCLIAVEATADMPF